MRFNDEQRKAIFGEEPLIVVSAGAGSGKTRVLTERYVRLCELKFQYQLGFDVNMEIGADVTEIVTLTFTEDAALEMRSRIRKKLISKLSSVSTEYPDYQTEAKEYWRSQIENLDSAIISTFHSFCQRIIQENSFEAKLFPDLKVMDDLQSKLLKSEILSKLLDDAEQQQKWSSLITSINRGSLQESLFLVQSKVREYEMSSSWRDLLKVDALVSSWKVKVEDEVNEFDRSFTRFFQSNPTISNLTPSNKKLYESLEKSFLEDVHGVTLLKSINKQIGTMKTIPKKILDQNRVFYELLQGWLKVKEFIFYQPMEDVILQFVELLEVFDEVYTQRKRELASLDFSDLQQTAIKLMDNEAFRTFYASTFKHFLVDEMQDTNQLQLRMIEKINPNYRFIVGDGKQSIYRFRGADVEIFNGLIKEAKDDQHFSFISMDTNYRTCDSIINFINLLFEQEQLMGQGNAEVLYKTPYSPMKSNRNNDQELKRRVEYIKVSEQLVNSEDQNEYVMIARRMVQLQKENTKIFDKDKEVWRPVEWRDMAVLIASRTNLTTLEVALKTYKIPYNVYGGLGFYDRQEVVDFISLLQWVNKPYELLYLLAVLRGPLYGVTMDEFLEIQNALSEHENLSTYIYEKRFDKLSNIELRGKLARFYKLYERWVPFHWSSSYEKYLMRFFEESNLKKVLLLQNNNLMKIKNVEKLIETICGLNAVSMEDMLIKLSILADLSKKEGDAEVELSGGNFVHIMTVHSSKGLEFPIVFVPNLSKGIPPERMPFRFDVDGGLSVTFSKEDDEDLLAEPTKIISPNFAEIHALENDQAIEESKRLFYVALTRARDYLILSSKDKGKKNTWYSWLEDALLNCKELADDIEIKEEVADLVLNESHVDYYEGPMKKLERAIPISFSVSEVVSYIDDRDSYIEKHLLKLDETWFEELETEESLLDEKFTSEDYQYQVDPRILGTIVHRICELLDKGYSEKDAYAEAFSIIAIQKDKEVYLRNVKPFIQSYQRHDFGEAVENEWQFVLDLDGVQIIGEIDKIVKTDGRIEVLDLKTNHIKDNVEELIEYYTPQLYLYKMAYEHEKQVEVEKMALVFLRDQKKGIHEVNYNFDYVNKLRLIIQEMANLKRELLG